NRADAPSAEGGWLDWLREQGVVGITDLDTRALVRHIRDAGAMRGGVFPASMPEPEAGALIAAEPPMAGRALARELTPAAPIVLEPLGDRADGPRIAVLDTGVKASIVRALRERGATVELHPCTTDADALLARDVDGVLLANGPGDPAALEDLVATVRRLLGARPVFGI